MELCKTRTEKDKRIKSCALLKQIKEGADFPKLAKCIQW